MNKIISTNYCILLDHVGKRSLSTEYFRLGFNFDEIKTVKKAHNSLNKYDAKIYL